MALFVVISDEPNTELDGVIASLYGAENGTYKLNDRVWLLSANKPISEINIDLGLPNGGRKRCVVFNITSNNAGWHQKTLWEWLALKEKSG